MYAPGTALEAGKVFVTENDKLNEITLLYCNVALFDKYFDDIQILFLKCYFTVTGFPLWASIIITGCVVTFYTTIVSTLLVCYTCGYFC